MTRRIYLMIIPYIEDKRSVMVQVIYATVKSVVREASNVSSVSLIVTSRTAAGSLVFYALIDAVFGAKRDL